MDLGRGWCCQVISGRMYVISRFASTALSVFGELSKCFSCEFICLRSSVFYYILILYFILVLYVYFFILFKFCILFY